MTSSRFFLSTLNEILATDKYKNVLNVNYSSFIPILFTLISQLY